jgi:hypothetical protein
MVVLQSCNISILYVGVYPVHLWSKTVQGSDMVDHSRICRRFYAASRRDRAQYRAARLSELAALEVARSVHGDAPAIARQQWRGRSIGEANVLDPPVAALF